METLTNLAQTFQSSTKEVMSRVNLLLKERNFLKEELEKLKNQKIEAKAMGLLSEAEAISEFRLLVKDLPEFDAQGLKRMATTLINRNPHLIVIFGSSATGKACIVGAAGQKAVDKGINMAEMIGEAAKVIQGGGGGTAKIAQAGGRDTRQLGQALQQYSGKVLARLKTLL